MRNVILVLLGAGFLMSSNGGCTPEPSTDQIQSKQTEQLAAEANRQVGLPNITNFTERKFFKMIRELCDTEVTTYTYIVDMHGQRHFLCESIGYGIPYSTQFTNPERMVERSGAHGRALVTLPQPEANGLFMPVSSSATWVLASTEEGIQPIYVESEILVSPFKLE